MAFPIDQRALLLTVKGIGPTVVDRLEQIGFDSLETLSQTNVDHVVRQIAAMLGTTCWRNSPQARNAIAAAIACATAAGTDQAGIQPPKRSAKN